MLTNIMKQHDKVYLELSERVKYIDESRLESLVFELPYSECDRNKRYKIG